MARTLSIPALESSSFHTSKNTNLHKIRGLLDAYYKQGLPEDFLLPRKLIAGIAGFMEQNSLMPAETLPNNKPLLQVCCLRCCKAHALASAKQYKLSEEGIKYLEGIFKTECGHNGFYLDKGVLRRCV